MVLDRGGAETLVMNLYRHMDRSKIQFDFLVHGDQKGAYEDEILALGGRIYHLPLLTLRTLWRYNQALKTFFENHKEYKIVHAHNSELGNFALRQAQRAGVPHRICHAHNAPVGISVKNLIRDVFKAHADLYTTERLACSETAGKWQFGKKTFSVIHNGIDCMNFRYNEENRKKMRQALKLDEKFVLGHVGRFVPQKNHTFLLRIFRAVLGRGKNAVLLLVGDGPLRQKLQAQCKQLGLYSKVLFLGVRDDVPAILSACDVFVFPSLFEGLGIGLIEAQASGLPCFARNNIPPQAAVTDLCSFLSSGDPEEWAERICSISYTERKKYYQKVFEAGYDISTSVDKLTDLYRCMQGERC